MRYLTVEEVLDLNGRKVRWEPDEALPFILRVAQHHVTLEEVVRFLQAHTSSPT